MECGGDNDVGEALWTACKCLNKRLDEQDIKGRFKTIQTTVMQKSAWILRRLIETWEDSLSLKHKKKS